MHKVCPRGTLARDGGRGPGGGCTTVDPFSASLCLAALPWNQVSGGMRSGRLCGPGGRAPCSLGVLGSCGQVKVLLESASRRWGDVQSKHAPNPPLLATLLPPTPRAALGGRKEGNWSLTGGTELILPAWGWGVRDRSPKKNPHSALEPARPLPNWGWGGVI